MAVQVPSNLIPVRITQLQVDPAPSENGQMVYTRDGNTYRVRVGDLLNVSGVPLTRQVIAGTGLTGGGQLSSNVTLSVAAGGIGTTQLASSGVTPGTYGSSSQVPVLTVDATGRVMAATTQAVDYAGYVPDTRQVLAGVGLTGGGPLSSNVTLAADFSNATPQRLDTSGTAGAATQASRSDHKHPAVNLADDDEVDGVLGLGSGGTARSIVPNPGAIVWSGADGLYLGPVGALGQVLVSAGTGEYVWGSLPTLAPMPANYVLAGPVSGASGLAAFRLLVNADIPAALSGKSLSLSSITTSSVDSTPVGAASASTGAFTTLDATLLNVDNLRLDGNTLSSTNTNGNVVIHPNGTGAVSLPAPVTDVDYLSFDTAPGAVPATIGTMSWAGNSTLGLQMTANVLQRVGESEYVYVRASAAITKGQLCYHTGAVGASGVITVAPTPLALVDPNQIVGVAAETIALNGFGLIQISGVLRGFNTTGSSVGETWADGDALYYNPAYVGSMTKVKPSAPNQKTYVGEVINAGSGGSGSMSIRIVQSSVLGGTDSNVQFSALANNDLVQYDSSLQYWKNVAASAATVGTATNAVNTAITNDTSTAAIVYPTWVTANTGNLPQKVSSTKLTFNPSTGVLTATGGIGGGVF